VQTQNPQFKWEPVADRIQQLSAVLSAAFQTGATPDGAFGQQIMVDQLRALITSAERVITTIQR
jgi:hypothetical protein